MLTVVLLASWLNAGIDSNQPAYLTENFPEVAKKLPLVAARRRPAKKSQSKQKEPPPPSPATESAPSAGPSLEGAPAGLGGRTRIEFEGQLIKGQTTKAGEVQILERKDSEIKSMVKRRTSFRDEIIKTVFPTVP